MYQPEKKLLEAIDESFEDCKTVSDYLTDHPEESGHEEGSVQYVSDFLRARGFEVAAPCAGVKNSFLAVDRRRAGRQEKHAVLMCEYDALPDVGHACGHSMSCAVSLLAGLALNRAFPELPIRMDLMGTPDEELHGGKNSLYEAGAFDDCQFAAMVHMHNTNMPHFRLLASNDLYITFHGKSAHASADPENGLNALNAARLYMDAMDMWRQHIPDDCQIHGIVEYGGEIPSIVPDRVELNYYFRADRLKKVYDLNEKARLAAEGAAMATGTSCSIEKRFPPYQESFFNDTTTRLVCEIFESLHMPYEIPSKPSGSSDVGAVDSIIPTFQPLIAVSDRKDVALHQPEFAKLLKTDSAYDALKNGAAVLASLAYRLATEENLLAEITAAHHAYRGIS